MYEDKVKKSLRKIIIFAVIIGIFLASIGAGFFYVIRTAFDRSTDERMIEETDNYKKRLPSQALLEILIWMSLLILIPFWKGHILKMIS